MARPTKLTPKTQSAIVDAIGYGATYAAAAGSAGVEYETFYNWMVRGSRGGDAPEDAPFIRFFNAVKKAEAECELKYTKVIFDKSKRDWRAALEWLKRRRRPAWGDNILNDFDINIFTPEELQQITIGQADPGAVAIKALAEIRKANTPTPKEPTR